MDRSLNRTKGKVDAEAAISEYETQANRLDLIARMADELTHEIKNPLNAVVVNLELIKRMAGDRPESAVERADIIAAEVARVHELVVALLRVLRFEDGVRQAELGGVLRTLRPLLAARAKLSHVDLRIDGEQTAVIDLSPGEAAQIVMNLADNAFDAMPEGGRLGIEARVEEGRAVLRIEDSGAGLPEDLAREPGRRHAPRRAGRRGLGLPVTAALVERLGGRLEVERSDGRGATLVVTIPLSASA